MYAAEVSERLHGHPSLDDLPCLVQLSGGNAEEYSVYLAFRVPDMNPSYVRLFNLTRGEAVIGTYLLTSLEFFNGTLSLQNPYTRKDETA